MINGERVEIADINLVLTLNAAGRGFISVNNLSPEHSLAGAMVQIDLGRDGEAWRYFSGYIERDQPAENGSRRLLSVKQLLCWILISLLHATPDVAGGTR